MTDIWHQTTDNVVWYLPEGVNPNTDPYESWFPQTLQKPANCGYSQIDTYSWDTTQDREAVDQIKQDGILTLKDGKPEDASLIRLHTLSMAAN